MIVSAITYSMTSKIQSNRLVTLISKWGCTQLLHSLCPGGAKLATVASEGDLPLLHQEASKMILASVEEFLAFY